MKRTNETRPSGASVQHPTITAEQFGDHVLERLRRDDGRIFDYYRIRELTPPFTKGWLFQCLRAGDLRAVKLGEILLIPGDSLRALLASAKEWTAR